MPLTRSWLIAAVTAVALSFSGATDVIAGTILLDVDVSNPSAVVISATGADADMSVGAFSPIELRDFFAADVGSGSAGSNLSLQITQGAMPIADARFDQSGPRNLDLTPNFPTASFVAGQQAFNGSGTFDLSGKPLAVTGTSGSIFVNGTEIGNWAVVAVPEPSSLALLGLGGLCFLSVLRHRD